MEDPDSLTAAFSGTDGVFLLPPSDFDPAPGFPGAHVVIAAVKAALELACPNKIVCLSTIGAQSTKLNLLTQRTLMEQALGELPMPIAFLRPGWFMEAVPRKTWQALFESEGMLHPLPRIQMLDGFNEGWIDFEGDQDSTVKGKVDLQIVLQKLVDRGG